MADLSEEELQALYCWIDEIPLSRAKKNITRDFSDGVLTAEIVHHFLPHLVELHNYSPANCSSQKVENWRTLNRKVFSKINFSIPDDIIQSVSASKPGVVEFILTTLRTKIERYLQNKVKVKNSQFEAEYQFGGPGNQLTDTEEIFQSFNPVPPQSGMRLLEGYDPTETHLPRPPLEYPQHHSVVPLTCPRPPPPLPPPLQKPQNVAPPPFASRLCPPVNYYHSPSSQEHSTSLPPIHLHPTTTTTHPVPDGDVRARERGLQGNAQNSTKLPNIHGRSNTYAGRTNRTGPQTNKVPSIPLKRDDSTTQQIRLAEKEQKLHETQEYIQLLRMKVTRLEHLVQIKDMKIEELYRKLAAAANSRNPLMYHKR